MLIKLALVILTLLAVSAWVPGIEVDNFYFALIVAIMLGIANITIKPILVVLTFPIHIITFGLSAFLINTVVFWFISTFVEGFTVTGFIPALIGSLAVSLASILASHLD